jgi:hypothetical protein
VFNDKLLRKIWGTLISFISEILDFSGFRRAFIFLREEKGASIEKWRFHVIEILTPKAGSRRITSRANPQHLVIVDRAKAAASKGSWNGNSLLSR